MKINSLIKFLFWSLIYLVTTSFQSQSALKGTWIYKGGVYNGQITAAPKDATLERVYSSTKYDAFITTKAGKTSKYEGGNYTVNSNKYSETQTFSDQPSPLKGKTLHYTWSIKNGRLILKGRLTDNSPVEEYWERVK